MIVCASGMLQPRDIAGRRIGAGRERDSIGQQLGDGAVGDEAG